MIPIRQKERSTINEFIVIFIKLIVYVALIYFRINKPLLYTQIPLFGQFAYALLVFTAASLSVSVIRFIMIYWYIRKNKLKSTVKDNFILGINRIVSVLNTVFFVISLMIFMGIDPIKFLTSITIVAAAIALTFKDYITNMINGLIIMFSDRLSLGDHIKVLDQEGKILDITLINIILQNEDNDMVLIPNSVIFTSMIVNQSKQNIKKLTIEFELDIKLGFTPPTLEKRLSKMVEAYADYIMQDGFYIKTLEIQREMAKFKIQILLKYHDKLKEREIRRVLNSAVLELAKGKA